MVDGQLFTAISAAVLAREIITLEDILLVEGKGILQGALNVAIEANDGGKDHDQGWRSDHALRILHPLCLSTEEQDDGPLCGANLQRLKRLVQHQNLYLVNHGV